MVKKRERGEDEVNGGDVEGTGGKEVGEAALERKEQSYDHPLLSMRRRRSRPSLVAQVKDPVREMSKKQNVKASRSE